MHVPEEAALKVGQANAMGLAEDLEECDWVVRHDTLETPDEYCGLPVLAGNEYCPEHQKNADAMAKRELEGKTCAYHCLTDGLTYIECPVHSPKNKEGDEPSTPREYPYTDGDIVVLGPGISVNPGKDIIYWEGRNFYPYDETPVREVTDKDRELIAANAKATIERRDRERAQKLLREMAMHHAVELQKAGLSAGHMPTKRVTEVADDILTWLTES